MGRHRVIGGTKVSVSYLGYDADDLGPTVAFGPAGERHIVVGVAYRNPPTSSITGITVGGVAATKLAGATSTNPFNKAVAEIWIAYVPTGTSGTVSLSTSGGVGPIDVACWAVYGLKSATQIDKDEAAAIAAGSLTSKARGAAFLVAASTTAGSPNTFALSGMTIDDQMAAASAITRQDMFAHVLTTGPTLAYTPTAPSNSFGADALVAISIR